MLMSKKESSGSQLLLHIATPFVLLLLSAAVTAVLMIKPSDKLKVYLNLAFMDSLKSDPYSDDTGLVIRDNDIIDDYTGSTSETGEVIRPKFGEKFAEISSERLSLDVPVYWGSTAELFEAGACQANNSAIIGTEGNAVISAHVDTFFAELDQLKEEDMVTVKTNYGVFEYKVKELITFDTNTKKYITPTEDTRLTLYTCKKDLLGNTDQRIGVICELVSSSFYTEEEGK